MHEIWHKLSLAPAVGTSKNYNLGTEYLTENFSTILQVSHLKPDSSSVIYMTPDPGTTSPRYSAGPSACVEKSKVSSGLLKPLFF